MSDVNYNLEASLVDNLNIFQGKRVNLMLRVPLCLVS